MTAKGRPRTFDREVALDAAMHLFWEQGYEATSLAQLKSAMGNGISSPSFYAAFKSKEALYRESLERYLRMYGGVTRSLHDESIEPREGIALALQRSARMQFDAGHPSGCMVALAAMSAYSSGSEEVAALLRGVRARTRLGFRSCLERGIRSGELSEWTDPSSLAVAFDSFFLGISVLARDKVGHAVVERAIAETMRLWDAARIDARH